MTLGDQAEYKSRGNEQGYSSLSRREAKPLPDFIELETPPLFNHEWIRNTKNHHTLSF
jgi:hypothetical protein